MLPKLLLFSDQALAVTVFKVTKSYMRFRNARQHGTRLQALTLYKHANVAVTLRGMNTPIMITLVSGQKVVDYIQGVVGGVVVHHPYIEVGESLI